MHPGSQLPVDCHVRLSVFVTHDVVGPVVNGGDACRDPLGHPQTHPDSEIIRGEMTAQSTLGGEPTVIGAVAHHASQQCSPDMPVGVHESGKSDGVRTVDDIRSGSVEAGTYADYLTVKNLDISTNDLAKCRVHCQGQGVPDDGVSPGWQCAG